MTVQQATQQLLFQLFHLYGEREARNIADLVMENVTEWKRIDRIMNKSVPLSPAKQDLLAGYAIRLLAYEPVQYVLQEAWFCGMKLTVNRHVLIPRPETEELAHWVVDDLKGRLAATGSMQLIDVGTGSGCIGIALKKWLPDATVCCCDVSEGALAIARNNAAAQETAIGFVQCDFLNSEARNVLPAAHVIVSNPPYIPHNDRASMHDNVLNYEPHLALFVEDDRPLLFYTAIADFAATRLAPDGAIYVEIHEDHGLQVEALFHQYGYAGVEVKKDLQGRNRMVKASRKKVPA